MTLTRLGPSDYRTMPWKNGGGSTTELIIHPAGAQGLAGFDWRLSVADLGSSGPFSPFPGYDRVILQLEGVPMTLRHKGAGEQRLAWLEPHRFAGEWETWGELPTAPARDFNVMTRRGVARADVRAVTLQKSGSLAAASSRADGTTMIYVVAGRLNVQSQSADKQDPFTLQGGELLVASSAFDLRLRSALNDSSCIVVDIANY